MIVAGSGSTAAARWSLLLGNLAIGCGVMVVPGAMNDLVRSLSIGVALGGQLVSVAALVMAASAPLLAWVLGRVDRRLLLALTLAWYAVGHALSAMAPDYLVLAVVRMGTMLAAALFTPQAAAAMGWLAPPEQRGRAITFIFLGWSLASVLGMPIAHALSEAAGWRAAFAAVAVLSAAAAIAVWKTLPAGVSPPMAGLDAWRAVARQPALLTIVAVTALAGIGQFSVFSYLAPLLRADVGADARTITVLFAWFGVFGFLGNVLVSRQVDRVGAAPLVTLLLVLMAATFALWPLVHDPVVMALVLVPWALACFASNSAQQARIGEAAPALSPVLMSLNTSAIYIGQALGAAGGGALIAANAAAGRPTYAGLWLVALAWMLLALAVSVAAQRWLAARVVAA